MDAIRCRDVRKEYGGVVAVDGVSLEFDPGRIHALVGPNGSGKTTLLRLLAGLVRPTGGTVAVPDTTVGVSFQQPSVYGALTVAENLAVFGSLAGADPEWRESLVERLRLDPVRGRVAADLSEGFAKKLDLALGLLKRPAVLLLDEPLADVDDLSRRRLLALLGEYATPQRVVVVSTHNVAEFGDSIDRLVGMYDGRVELDAPAADLEDDPAAAYDRLVEEWA